MSGRSPATGCSGQMPNRARTPSRWKASVLETENAVLDADSAARLDTALDLQRFPRRARAAGAVATVSGPPLPAARGFVVAVAPGPRPAARRPPGGVRPPRRPALAVAEGRLSRARRARLETQVRVGHGGRVEPRPRKAATKTAIEYDGPTHYLKSGRRESTGHRVQAPAPRGPRLARHPHTVLRVGRAAHVDRQEGVPPPEARPAPTGGSRTSSITAGGSSPRSGRSRAEQHHLLGIVVGLEPR